MCQLRKQETKTKSFISLSSTFPFSQYVNALELTTTRNHYRKPKYVGFGKMILIENIYLNNLVMRMTYMVEIELLNSCTWFKYVTEIESREEAENIKREAEGKVKARVRKVLRTVR